MFLTKEIQLFSNIINKTSICNTVETSYSKTIKKCIAIFLGVLFFSPLIFVLFTLEEEKTFLYWIICKYSCTSCIVSCKYNLVLENYLLNGASNILA